MKPLTPKEFEAQQRAEQRQQEHAARREEHLLRLCGARPLEPWACERIAQYWQDLYKRDNDNVRKSA